MKDYFNGRDFKEDIPALSQTVYLNSAGQGPKPRCVIDRTVYYYEKTLYDGACIPPLLNEIADGERKAKGCPVHRRQYK